MSNLTRYRSFKRFRQGDDLPTPADGFRLRVLRIPDVPWVRNLINAQLSELVYANRFSEDPFLDVSKDDAAQIFAQMWLEFCGASPMIGTICIYATASPPDGVLPLDGSNHARADYPLLYNVLHTSWKNIDGLTFDLPDMIGSFPMGGTPSLTGGGEATVTLTTAEMPAHTHGNTPHFHAMIGAVGAIINGGIEAPAAAAIPTPSATDAASVNILSEGGGQPHNNIPPYIPFNYGIWYI